MKLNTKKFRRNPKTAWQHIDDKVVVVTPDTKKIHILYDSGVSIWEYLNEPKSLDVLIADLQSEYDVASPQAEADIKNYLSDLSERQIISAC